MDGIEAARQIRALPDGNKIKIVVVTASSFMKKDSELLAVGFDAIVHKPYRVEHIFNVYGTAVKGAIYSR